MLKETLPDTGNEYESEDCDVTDSINFILKNLTEMNRLWIRLQYLSTSKDKETKEKQRSSLRVTVGENISRLSQLNGIDEKIYSGVVLPKLLETIVQCKDTMSQQYLMECII